MSVTPTISLVTVSNLSDGKLNFHFVHEKYSLKTNFLF